MYNVIIRKNVNEKIQARSESQRTTVNSSPNIISETFFNGYSVESR